MSRDRKQQRRRQRLRQRGNRPSFEPVGSVRLPGIMGWFQRNPRLFYVGGIAVMVLSLGAVFFGTQTGQHSATPDTVDTPADAAEVAETPTPPLDASPPTEATPDERIQRVYSVPPPFEIDPTHTFTAVIRTEKGNIRLELLPAEAPGFVNNFVFLARNDFYDGLTFHRVVPGFVAQAGDPTATGIGGAGYDLPEDTNDLAFDAGVISMAKADSSGDLVNGAQFFITLDRQPALADNFTVFGRVTEGLAVLRALQERDPSGAGQPAGDRILDIEIIESAGDS